MSETILNDRIVAIPASGANLLDFLRRDAGLTGAKPACRGGDCGACQVLLGEVAPGVTAAQYRPVNTCLLSTGRAIGCHVITVEGLTAPGGPLTPVQRALVDHGGIQCGYCTPGFVIALTGALLAGTPLLDAIDGNLCRCTGYSGIRRACAALEAQFPRRPLTLAEAAALGLLTSAVADAGAALTAPPPEVVRPGNVVGGETDWAVQHPYATTPGGMLRLHRVPELRGITPDGDWLAIGAAATVAEVQESPLVAAAWPTLPEFLGLFASPGIRASATVGGNLANASPAADISVVLLALGAEVEVSGSDGARRLPLAEFFLGYKRTALAPGDVITTVRLPRNAAGALRLSALKVSRRPHDDITSVTSALVVGDGAVGGGAAGDSAAGDGATGDGARFGPVQLAAGGVAPVPFLLPATATVLSGAPVDAATLRAAVRAATAEATPIDDLRGSAAYKRALLGHQLVAHVDALFPGTIDWRECLS